MTPAAGAIDGETYLPDLLATDVPGIAVIGMSGRFPGAADLDELWDNLCRGVESIARFTEEEMRAAGVDAAQLADPRHVAAGGVLAGADLFDAPLFSTTPREAELLDPQQRVFLECAWAALEDAGYDPARAGHGTGVFAGASLPGYLLHNLLPAGEVEAAGAQAVLANDKDFLTTRLSYKLGLTGPSLDVQTACSTSLVAVVLACQSLLNYQCDLALAGGVSVREPQRAGYLYQEGGILSPDGHCRPFDAAARGTVPGNGVGIVVLKRLEDALADGDAIRAVVRGAALNNDGCAKAGYTAPSVTGQAEVIAMALAIAATAPEEVGFVEAHGTATPLGDPIEMRALARAFRGTEAPERSCAIGSIKGNIGHLDAAAGIAGFIKAVLALERGAIPPTLHFERPNPGLELDGTPFYVNSELVPWESGGERRRAGVSSFGIGGTNAHVILEEAPPASAPRLSARAASPTADRAELLVLSARTPEALATSTARLATHLAGHLTGHLAARPGLALADVAKTLRLGRRQLPCRRALVARSVAEAAEGLLAAPASTAADDPPSVAFLLPGQGTEVGALAAELYREEEVFRDELDACSRALEPCLGLDLRTLLLPSSGAEAAARERLADTALAQPALLAFELALARLWCSWGVKPAALLGHSLGELAAACLAGVLPRDAALALVAERGRLMASRMPEGAMLAVPLGEADLLPLLDGDLALAAVNATDRTVASGPPEAVARLAARLAERGIRARPLDVRRAFHSPAIEGVLAPWREALRRAPLSAPAIPCLSNRSGTWVTAEQATDAESWSEPMRHPVRFAAGVAELLAEPDRILLEVGPGGGLAALARRTAAGDVERIVVSSLPDGGNPGSAHAHLLAALGRLWCAGVAIDWDAVSPGRGRRVPLPTYPFERRRYWIPAPPKGAVGRGPSPRAAGDGKASGETSVVWVPLWRQALAPATAASGGGETWLVLTDGSELGAQLLAHLAARQGGAIAVAAGRGFARVSERAFVVDPERAADFDALLAAIREAGADERRPLRAVHLWSLHGGDAEGGSLVRLAEALGRWGGASSLDVVTAGTVELDGSSLEPKRESKREPRRAALVGLCRALAGERACRLIDLPAGTDLRSAADARPWVGRLAAELTAAERPDGIVALREKKRWVEQWVATEPAARSGDPVLRRGGRYLVAGDLGRPIATAILEALAVLPARVVLVGRKDGNGQAPEPLPLDPVWLAERAVQLAPEGSTSPPEALDVLCGGYVLAALAGAGVEPGREMAEEEIRRRISLAPRRERLFERLLSILEEDGAIAREGGAVRFLRATLTDLSALRGEIESRSPELASLCGLLDRAAGALPQVLSGEIEGLAVLYPEGGSTGATLFQGVGEKVLGEKVPGDFSADLPTRLIVEALSQAAVAARQAGRPFRILEVGAGHGLLTQHLFPALEATAGPDLEYVFTDVGRSFVLAAERRAAVPGQGGGRMRFGVLDVSRDPVDQGYAPSAFDAVVAANVVHATPRIVETLGHLRTLLAPGGILGLVETVRRYRWADLVWGLTDGWWSFDDPELRTGSPLLSSPAWRDALAAAGFETSVALPEEGTTESGSAAVLARRPVASNDLNDLFVAADLSDLTSLATAVAEARRRLGGIDGVFYAAPSTALPALAGARSVSAALAGGAPPRFLALCAEPAAVPALARWAASATPAEGNDSPKVLTLSWTGVSPGLSRIGAALAIALASDVPETSLSPPALPRTPEPAGERHPEPMPATETNLASPGAASSAPGFHDRPRLVNPYVAPRNEIELAVAAIWKGALGIDRIGVDDNFLELGGDSLTGLQVAHAIATGWELDGRAFSLYATPTVASIARWIADDGADGRGDDPPAAAPGVSRGERRRARRTAARRTEP